MGPGFLEVLRARDISVGGLGVHVPHGFAEREIDTEVELIVTLGRARPFRTRGALRHHSATSRDDRIFGIEFTSLLPEHRQAVEAYIESCAKVPSVA